LFTGMGSSADLPDALDEKGRKLGTQTRGLIRLVPSLRLPILVTGLWKFTGSRTGLAVSVAGRPE
jgi:hypothetical protein